MNTELLFIFIALLYLFIGAGYYALFGWIGVLFIGILVCSFLIIYKLILKGRNKK